MRKTCYGCENLEKHPMHIGKAFAYGCRKTGLMIPHSANESIIRFWRIPLSCPLPDTEVVKSETKANPKDWKTIEMKDWEPVTPLDTRE